MNSSYYFAARAMVAFDVFMVIAFTVTLLAMARSLSQHFVRALAAIWLVYVVRVVERTLYFGIDDRTSLVASALFGVFAASCILPVRLLRRVVHPGGDPEPFAWRDLTWWSAGAFIVGAALHAGSAQLGGSGFEFASAIWSRLLAGIPLLLLVFITASRRRQDAAVRPLFWGFSVQFAALLIDALVRARSFSTGLSPLDERLVSAMTLASTLSFGIASIFAAVEKERDMMAERARRLQVAQERALESERWQQVGQLARGVAHDLNNVLGALLAGGELVEEGIRTQAKETPDDFGELERTLSHGRSLTARMLRFAKHRSLTPKRLVVGDVGRHLVPTLKRLTGPERTLDVACTDSHSIWADATAIEQVMLNFVVNARDATEPGGAISLRVFDDHCNERRHAAVGALEPGDYVCISVTDNGTGMPPHVLERLWEPFFTTKGDRGSGIGLPTVAAVLAEIGGAIDVESQEGTGTRFQAWVPTASQGT